MKDGREKKQVGRLAFRVEGDKWTCYYARPDTMDGAVWMGTVKTGIVRDPERKEMFMALMRHALNDFLEEKLGSRVEMWDEHLAPESERSGSA